MSEKPRSGTLLRQQMRRERYQTTTNNNDNDDDNDNDGGLSVSDVTSMQWRTAVKLVEDGEADGILSELREAEHRQSVLDAISERLE